MSDLQARLAAALAGRYRIERELGRGGMAIVYLAHDARHDRVVALKVLRPELGAALGQERFLREIKLAAGLTHPHIVPLFDSGDADGSLFYVMPYLAGESLRHRLQREGRLPLADALEITRDVADALAYAHRQNIVHRDIKPENILFESGHAVVSDFGIARAISAAGGARITGTGLVVGTPDYMSPEHASGEEEVDGRTDIYSLACVLFEMLAGRPPRSVVSAARSGSAVPTTWAVSSVPAHVARVIGRALAERREERFATAGDFAAALADAAGADGRRRRARRWWAGLASAAALGAAAVMILPRLLGAGLDPSLYVVVPFGHRGGAAPALLNGDQCELLLYNAFARWEDVRLVNDLWLHDAVLRRGGNPATLGEALDIARQRGAGLLVWGELTDIGDSIQVAGGLYDVAHRGRSLRSQVMTISKGREDLASRFAALADSLLLGGARSKTAPFGAVRTRRLTAWLAYDAGHAALAAWNLDSARVALRAAVDSDPAFPDANLWLAQVLAWTAAPASDWSAYAARAEDSPMPLPARERALAEALSALAQRRYGDACGRYRLLLRRDSTDFAAWFGLGECQAQDRVVVPDRASPSGWRFRASLHDAIAAYGHALQLNPSVHHAFGARLPQLIFIEANYFRLGRAPLPDTTRFGAWPALAGDTLAFVPYPLGPFLAGAAGTVPATQAAAIRRNREILRQITRRWIAAFPASAAAREALAAVLETTEELAPGRDDEHSALATVRQARARATDPTQHLRLVATEVRTLLKLEDFAAARRLADSVGRDGDTGPTPADALHLAGLAALTGRADRAAALLRRALPEQTILTPDGQRVTASPALLEAGATLLAYAAVGGPVDSLAALERRIEGLMQTAVRPERRAQVRAALLGVPAVLAFPVWRARPARLDAVGRSYLHELQAALARGDTARVRRDLAALAAVRRGDRPGDVAIDATYQEAYLELGLGDTLAAIRRLDGALTALPTLGTDLVTEVPQAAGLVRSMALRAELAAARGDRDRTQWWAQAALALWSGGDAAVAPVLRRLRALLK